MDCGALLLAAMTCVSSTPAVDPARFGRVEVFSIHSDLPDAGPIPLSRPVMVAKVRPTKPAVRDRKVKPVIDDVQVMSYAPIEKPSIGVGKLYQLADGNEDMGCIKNNKVLMNAIAVIKKKYGRAVIIDSAYRSPSHNRAVRGAKRSLHMRCAALDLAVPGINKEALFAFAGTIPGIGGRGIYNSGYIHIDTGPRRTWDWRRRKKK